MKSFVLRLALLSCLCNLLLPLELFAQTETANPPAESPVANTPPAYGENATPEELLKAVEQSWQTPIEVETEQEEQQVKIQILNHIVTGSGLILKNEKASEQIALSAVQNKMQALGILARAGDPNAPVQAMAMARDLAEDKRPLVAREGKLILISSQLQQIPEMEDEDRAMFAKDLINLLSSAEISDRELQIGTITATLLEQAEDYKAAQSLLTQLSELAKKSPSPAIRAQAAELAGTARRLGLPGSPLQLTGQTLAGDKFDLKDLKGKVVLVQYWASWCTYCLQEMPHIRQMYNIYHDEGFEVIGVNLDDSADRAQAIIDDMKLPWPQLFSNDPDALGMENPNATRYGINSIPQCILVDREGNVVTLQARGKVLDVELERLFEGSAEPAPEK